MLSSIETFLFKEFQNQPLWVRVLTYLVLLGVFVYLILIPRFIDGQLVVKDPITGGLIPYRGANIQMQVDGRDYKFKSNESGYFSIPIISKLPTQIEFQVFHEDKAQWFKINFTAMEAWGSNSRQVEVRNSAPFVKIASKSSRDVKINLSGTLNQLPIPGFSVAHAGELILPSPSLLSPVQPQRGETPGNTVSSNTQSTVDPGVRKEVVLEMSKVLGTSPDQIGNSFPLIGANAPDYVKRIQIIEKLEQHFEYKIPDEHWKTLKNVEQLVNYIQQRDLLLKRFPKLKGKGDNWPEIQQSLPTDQRPEFRAY